ncbi:MAG TPA: hypothetical protein VK814_07635 [Acidobacteriaceae bacterium]|nr:hypothetical protein [Acidobacteriaceae bacterium]
MNLINTSSLLPAIIRAHDLNPSLDCPPSIAVFETPSASQDVQVEPRKPSPKRDPYSISEDGHFVGHDGFIVPICVEEFIERYPRYIRDSVRRRLPHVRDLEREDYESEVLIFLMVLPEESKFCAPGYNGFPHGCRDRIQTFNPDQSHGASEPRFLNYLKMILTNYLNSLWKRAQSNPIQRYDTLDIFSSDANGNIVDDAYIANLTSEGSPSAMTYDQMLVGGILVDEFVCYVKQHDPELVEVMGAIQMTDTYIEAQRVLGLTERFFARARSRLAVLFCCFDRGEYPPQQRKVYRERTNG